MSSREPYSNGWQERYDSMDPEDMPDYVERRRSLCRELNIWEGNPWSLAELAEMKKLEEKEKEPE